MRDKLDRKIKTESAALIPKMYCCLTDNNGERLDPYLLKNVVLFVSMKAF